ncbi:hypothetical protein AQPE_0044 [Aquipluma nitroreducens]|uniref:DUF302 domain-containing protein n=1 Tax=Aquipluma nitroreducens TaxID=2010828 RepID=A0A5K7S2P3_9BACT|nr:DUF302 domain-containing protein [Aquipluma nitroreducens]BBE15908.1 hypothetical protein AQPE_0044 [Aquipluma nitroreducens]
MKYYITKKIDATFEQAIDRVKESLGIEGFGVLSEINLHDKFKEKLNVDFRKYTILGACNPAYAYKAVQSEDKIGTMLPCNVVVQDLGKNVIEVTAVDPVASMMAIDNPKLAPIAEEVKRKLTRAIESLHNGVESFGLV